MYLTGSQFSFCKEVGLLKENFTKERAYESICNSLKGQSDCDPKFLAYFQNSKNDILNNGAKYVAVIYNYDIDLDYVRRGSSYHTTVNGFGNSGAPSSLKVTQYYQDGNYTKLTDASACKYPVWNQNNVFNYEEIKSALKSVIEGKIPSDYSSYKSRDWTVSAYFVPIFYFTLKYNGSTYAYEYNLHNGCYHYTWAVNGAIEKKAKTANIIHKFIHWGTFVAAAINFIVAVATDNVNSTLAGAACVLSIIMLFARKRDKYDFKEKFKKRPKRWVVTTLIPDIIVAFLVFIAIGATISI